MSLYANPIQSTIHLITYLHTCLLNEALSNTIRFGNSGSMSRIMAIKHEYLHEMKNEYDVRNKVVESTEV